MDKLFLSEMSEMKMSCIEKYIHQKVDSFEVEKRDVYPCLIKEINIEKRKIPFLKMHLHVCKANISLHIFA